MPSNLGLILGVLAIFEGYFLMRVYQEMLDLIVKILEPIYSGILLLSVITGVL